MIRPWQVWLVFLGCTLAAGAGMAWLTRQALHADELRRTAEAGKEFEQRVSLALWRMDTELAPIIAEEVIRPANAFRPGKTAIAPPPYVLLQCEANENEGWVSPQQPRGKEGKPLPELVELQRAVDLQNLLAELPDTPLPMTTQTQSLDQLDTVQQSPAQQLANNSFYEDNTANALPIETSAQQARSANAPLAEPNDQAATPNPKAIDFLQRGQRYQTATAQNLRNRSDLQQAAPFDTVAHDEQVGVSRPMWIGDRLMLVRRVMSNGETAVQSTWLDWSRLKERLLSECKELLPQADLVPIKNGESEDPGRMLAGLPVKLVTNELPAIGVLDRSLNLALWTGWGAAALAVLAAAALLYGVMALSERRAAFVSSVTHELRTPLTTFRMYSEMLARGMVPDADRRQEYFNTLQHESERLTLLVENVLSYARLERGRKPQGQDRVTMQSLLDRTGPRLAQRATQAGMTCDIQIDKQSADCEFTTDQSVVEQILFNLVDNAAKYARGSEDNRIHIETNREGEWGRIVVRDHGPGIELSRWRGPRAFGKTAEQSAETAPGVGLGLVLCQGLARQIGGRLEIGKANNGGATVSLWLPLGRAAT